MIHSIVGLQNAGKTQIAVFFAYLDYLRGRKIVSNIRLSFPHYFCNTDFIKHLGLTQPDLKNVTFILDEAWISLTEARNSMSIANKVSSWFFLQSSKNNSNIYLTAQSNNQNDTRIRDNQHRLTQCQRVQKVGNDYKPILIEERDLSRYFDKDGVSLNDNLYIKAVNYKRVLDVYNGIQFRYTSTLYLKSKVFQKLYNTYEKKTIVK